MTEPTTNAFGNVVAGPFNRVIWKYILAYPADGLDMPSGAQILAVGQQRGMVVLWAGVDPDMPTEHRNIQAIPTGGEINHPAAYHGTIQMPGGIVWHIVETQ